MKKRFLIPIIALTFAINSQSQNYNSDLEKEVFETFNKDSLNIDFIKSLSVIDTTLSENKLDEYYNRIQYVINNIPKKEAKANKEKKRIKLIYDRFHKLFFKKYEANSYFTEIFTTGNYNCVTATAMYAYVFDKLNIPYHIKELPSHVYLIAYPKTYKIHLETTVPGQYGFIVPKDSEKKKIVDELISLKLVSRDELNQKGYKQLYEDYFYGKEFINKKALIGMQYFNKSLTNYEQEDYISAQKNISKSVVFYKSPFSKLLHKDILKFNISKLKLDSKNDIELLYNNFSELEYKKDFEISEVKFILYKIIENDTNDIEFIEYAASKLSKFDNIELNNLCTETLYEYIARSKVDRLYFEEAIKYGTISLNVNPNNKVIKEIISYAVFNQIKLLEPNLESLNKLENYYTTYPFLENEKRIETLKLHLYADLVVQEFYKKNVTKALDYLSKVENLMDNKRDYIAVNQRAIAELYLLSGRYFYGRSKFKQAKCVFKKGTEYVPENTELKKMYKWASEDLN